MPRFRLLLISGVVGLTIAGCDDAKKTAAVDLRQCPKNDAQACATITPATPATTAKPTAGADKAAATKTASAKTAKSATAKSTTVVKSPTTTTQRTVASRGRVERHVTVAANGRHGRHVERRYVTVARGEKHGVYQRYHGEDLLGGQDDRITIERRYAGRPDLDNAQVYGGQSYGSRAFDGHDDHSVTVERGYGRREEFNGYSRPPEDNDRGYSASRAQSDAARALAQRDERHGGMAQRQYSEQQYGNRGYVEQPAPPPVRLAPPPPPPPPRPPVPPRPPLGYQDGRSHVQSGSTYSYEEQSREQHRSSSEQYSSGGVVRGPVIQRRLPPPPPPRARVPDGSYGPSSDSGYRRAGQDDRGFLNWAGKVEY